MKEAFKTISIMISGLISSAFAGIESVRLSIMQLLFQDFNQTFDIVSRIVALIISVLSAIYLYYKIKTIILEYREKVSKKL